MPALVLLGLLFFAGAFVLASLFAVAIFVKLLVRLVLLPLFLLKWLISGIVFLIVGPVLAVVGIIILAAIAFALAVPLLPFIVLGVAVWLLMRNSRPATTSALS